MAHSLSELEHCELEVGIGTKQISSTLDASDAPYLLIISRQCFTNLKQFETFMREKHVIYNITTLAISLTFPKQVPVSKMESLETSNLSDGAVANPFRENALLNNLVIQRIFRYLEPSASFHTLKNIRLVCRVWRDESLSLWRKTAVLKLISDQELNLLQTLSFQVSTFSQLFQRMQDPLQFYRLTEKPFHKYKLEYVKIHNLYSSDQNSDTSFVYTNQFWHSIGPNVRHLVLNCVGFIGETLDLDPGPEYENQLLCFLTKYMPNLESLTVKSTRVPGRPRRNSSFVNMSSQIQHTNLTSLNCENLSYFSLANFPNIQNLSVPSLDSFLHMIQYKPILLHGENQLVYPTVKSLTIIFPRDAVYQFNTIDAFRRVRFPAVDNLRVTTQAFPLNNISNPLTYLSLILENHSKQLNYLELFIPPCLQSYTHFNFHYQFDQLTELRVYGDVLSDLSILSCTPKLKKLHIDLYCLERQEDVLKLGNEQRPVLSVLQDGIEVSVRSSGNLRGVVAENLEYLQINCKLSVQSLNTLGECMPNLKTLKTVLRHGALQVICKLWPLLENLEGTYGSTLVDSEVTGTGIEGEKCLKELKQLRRFHLKAYCNEGMLTDAAVLSGFLEIKKLTDLQVCVSPKFSTEAETLLKDRIFNVHIIRNYIGNKAHQNWECCQNYKYMQQDHSDFPFESLSGCDLASITLLGGLFVSSLV